LLDVIKDVDTRWNSTFHSIEHLVYLRPATMQLYSTLNNHALREVRKGAEMMSSFLPSEEEFELLEELIVILSPFDEATQFLSGSKYPTLGFMTPMLEELAHQLKYFTGHNEEAIFVRDTILDNLIEWWGDPSKIANNNNTISNQSKKPKMSAFFSHLQTENTNTVPDEFDRYCELPEISLDEEPCPL
ncbi:38169_t:CDS:2, partial [Gigaspora margarita]